jgi:hypothetical protein
MVDRGRVLWKMEVRAIVPDDRLTSLTLTEAAALLRRRAISPVELATAVLERIAALEPMLHAFTTLVEPDAVRAAAREAEREIQAGRYRGPLHGVPVGVKDLIDTAGLRTTYGSAMFRDHVPTRDGAVPARLREAGAILVGKTAAHELGMGITTNNRFFGASRNPWRLDHPRLERRRRRRHRGARGESAPTAAAPSAFRPRSAASWSVTLGLVGNRGQFGWAPVPDRSHVRCAMPPSPRGRSPTTIPVRLLDARALISSPNSARRRRAADRDDDTCSCPSRPRGTRRPRGRSISSPSARPSNGRVPHHDRLSPSRWPSLPVEAARRRR